MKKIYCSQCKKGDYYGDLPVLEPFEADYMVKGKIYIDDNKTIPYRAYLCDEHLILMNDDGAELIITEYISEMAKNILVNELTGYNHFRQLCKGNPTLRTDKVACPDDETKRKMLLLRKYYKEKTGEIAFR